MRHIRLAITTFLALGAVAISAQRADDPISRITEADIKRDLFALAGDEMRGREGGTLDEMAASVWLAERAREAGLQPAGENGTYFQFFPLERFRVSASSVVTLGGKKLVMGKDVVTGAVTLANVDAPIVLSEPGTTTVDVKDKVLMTRYVPTPPAAGAPATPPVGPNAQAALRSFATNVQRTATGAAAIVIVVPDTEKEQWERVSAPFQMLSPFTVYRSPS